MPPANGTTMTRLRNILILTAAAASVAVQAQTVSPLHISDLYVSRSEGKLKVSLRFDPKNFRQSLNQQTRITPVLRSLETGDTLAFPTFSVAGKNSYFHTLRNEGEEAARALYRSGKSEAVGYEQTVDWQPWMQHSRLDFDTQGCGCCGAPKGEDKETPAAELDFRPRVFSPAFNNVTPVAAKEKIFDLSGQAFINFPVNKTVIYPDYMSNPEELRKILDTIDKVRENSDATVTMIKLTGYASPEGPYDNNVRLAKGRTEALMQYVRRQYDFPARIFQTASVPEDWAGLRVAVEKSVLADREEILRFIDADHPIRTRNDELRRRFPQSYAYLLKNVYPSLRHTDYVIEYEVKKYTDVEEIKRVMKTRPQNLSLDEFYLAAETYRPGSPEYDEVFDIAVRMYPEDPVANLNAANAAMNHGDYANAAKYLDRAGNGIEAEYARGILAALKGDYDAALPLFRKAEAAGIKDAKEAIRQIEELKAYKGDVTYINS